RSSSTRRPRRASPRTTCSSCSATPSCSNASPRGPDTPAQRSGRGSPLGCEGAVVGGNRPGRSRSQRGSGTQGRDDGAHEEAQGEHRDHRRDEHGEPHPGDLTMRRELDHRTARGPRAELTEEGPPVAETPSHRRRNLAPGDDDGEPDELHADRDRPRGVPPAREVTEPRDYTEDERDGHEREKLLDPVEHHEPEHSDLPGERTP